jgi:hypothetical protein
VHPQSQILTFYRTASLKGGLIDFVVAQPLRIIHECSAFLLGLEFVDVEFDGFEFVIHGRPLTP